MLPVFHTALKAYPSSQAFRRRINTGTPCRITTASKMPPSFTFRLTERRLLVLFLAFQWRSVLFKDTLAKRVNGALKTGTMKARIAQEL